MIDIDLTLDNVVVAKVLSENKKELVRFTTENQAKTIDSCGVFEVKDLSRNRSFLVKVKSSPGVVTVQVRNRSDCVSFWIIGGSDQILVRNGQTVVFHEKQNEDVVYDG